VPVTIYDTNNPPKGQVLGTNNALVANYVIPAPPGAKATVQFGTTTAYGLNTSSSTATASVGGLAILVAGMRASTTYHMQAALTLPSGQIVMDQDQTFTTGALPAGAPTMTVTQTPGLTPADGVELFCLIQESNTGALTAVITDLSGNVIWYYPIQPDYPFPMKLLPNGHILVVDYGDESHNAAEEIDLAGNILTRYSIDDLQAGLKAAGYTEFPTLNKMHHDITKLPNGHFILLFNFSQTVTDPPGTGQVSADGLADYDPATNSIKWAWNSMDHIPISHAPNGTADWTHSNAIVYSPDDGNLIMSMRNQDWVLKIKYPDGAGDGSILWHLGPGGDFTLPSGQDPIEWNYGQHYPTFMSPNTSDIFSLMVFNNGNGRMVDSNNDVCGTTGVIACYSSVPVFQLNETTHQAQIQNEINLAPVFSFCCGNAEQLPNGDFEYDVADDLALTQVSYIQEVTNETTPQLVWQLNVSGELAYRGFRIPSLYPGVTWTQAAIAQANVKPAAQAASKSAVKAAN